MDEMNESTSTETTDVVEDEVAEATETVSERDLVKNALAVTPISLAQLGRDTGLSKAVVRKHVAELVEDGTAIRDDQGVRLVESAVEAPVTRPDAENGTGLVRAIRLGHEVEYGRGQCVTERNTTVTSMLNEAKADGITVDQVADTLHITKGAARHAIWRLRGGPASKAEGGFMHRDLRICDRLKRNTFALLEYLPDPAQDTDTADEDDESKPDETVSVDESTTDESNSTPEDEASSEDTELVTA